jgi:hypothetical protein
MATPDKKEDPNTSVPQDKPETEGKTSVPQDKPDPGSTTSVPQDDK